MIFEIIPFDCGSWKPPPPLPSSLQQEINLEKSFRYQFSPIRVFQGQHEWGFWDVKFVPIGSSLVGPHSPDKNPCFISCGSDASIRLWNIQDGLIQVLHQTNEEFIQTIAISPRDGTTIAFACRADWSSDDYVGLRLKSGKIVALQGHAGYINRVQFSPDGTILAWASDNGSARLWCLSEDYTECIKQLDLKGHKHCVNSIVFTPDGKLVVTASDDETIRFWRCDTGICIRTIPARHTPTCLAFTPRQGRILFSGGDHQTIMVHQCSRIDCSTPRHIKAD